MARIRRAHPACDPVGRPAPIPAVPRHGPPATLARRTTSPSRASGTRPMSPAPREVIATCPVCDHRLEVTRLHCAECDTTLEGRFSVGRFGRLNREQLGLLETFLRA